MPIEGWRSLLGIDWAGYVELHNQPFFGMIEVHTATKPPTPVRTSLSSVYEMQKSAAYWLVPDFTALSGRQQ